MTTRLTSRIAVLILALASSYYMLYTIRFYFWGQSADFGISIDRESAIVNEIDPRNSATGIAVGDRIDLAAMSFQDRGYLYEIIVKPVGLQMVVPVIHDGRRLTATFETVNESHALDGHFFTWGRKVVAMLFIAMGIILVWNRPSIMLWGLAVFLIGTHDFVVGPFPSPAVAGLVIFTYAFVSALPLPGLMAFAARFPDGRASRSTKYWNVAAAGVFIFCLLDAVHEFAPLFTARPIRAWPDFTYLYSAIYVAVFVALCIQRRRRKKSRTGLDWIVAGYGIGIVIGRVGLNDLFDSLDLDTYWPQFGQLLVMLAMPASVAYSVIRYRTFGLGFLANRALVFAALTIAVASTFVIAVWATSTELPSTLGIGGAMFVALLAGMMFQAQHGRAIRIVDRIFLPHRYEAGVLLDRIRERLRGSNDAKRVAGEVAETLGLASVAVFERTLDGGFVRNVACGWPDGAAWHLLPGEALTHSLDGGPPVITLPDELIADYAFPTAHARPRVALTIRRGGRVERAVFVGPYQDGARLDRDAIRSVHGLFDDALAV
jgi:hypothetical protein